MTAYVLSLGDTTTPSICVEANYRKSKLSIEFPFRLSRPEDAQKLTLLKFYFRSNSSVPHLDPPRPYSRIPADPEEFGATSTDMTPATYRLTRDRRSPTGFLSSQRPSTNAMNAIEKWRVAGSGRSYVVVDDQDDYLVAKLTLVSVDIDEFNALCAQVCVKHEVVPS